MAAVQWYLLKTWTGREEELLKEIRRTVPKDRYKECFVIYQERIWRKQQRSIVHRELLFPGCVFLICDNKEKIELGAWRINAGFDQMERITAVSRPIANGSFTILPMMKEDAAFLEKLSGKDHLVRLSWVIKDEQGKICRLSGPLDMCRGEIERIQWKKRYAMIRHRLWGEEQVIVLGIVLKEDENRVYLSNYGVNEENLAADNRINGHLPESTEIPAEAMA